MKPRIVASGFSHLEGPRWHEGAIYMSDFYTNRVLKVTANGSSATVCGVPGRPSGLGWDGSGNLLIASMQDERLLRFRGGQLEQVAELSPYVGGDVNDLIVDRQGRAYLGNFGSRNGELRPTTLVCVDPDGSIAVVADDLWLPNGMAISQDGKTLLVAETFAFRITAFSIAEDGSLSDRRVWARFGEQLDTPTLDDALATGALLPDGVCLDAAGNLWVADAAGAGAFLVAEGGAIVEQVEVDSLTVYALVLGGDDGKSLFLCCGLPLTRVAQGHPMIEHNAALMACEVSVGAA